MSSNKFDFVAVGSDASLLTRRGTKTPSSQSAGHNLKEIRSKRPRLRFEPEAYREFCREVLERDGWRCQSCGRMEDLQAHHIQWRSRLGEDTAENLIALCAICHKEVHRKKGTVR